MRIKAEESSGFERPHVQEGLHHAQFLSASSAPDGKFGARIALDFVVYPGKTQKPVKIGRVFGKKLTPKARLWEALESIGANLEVGKEFDIDSLLGKKCRVMVEDYKDNEGKMVSGITKVKTPDVNTITFIEEVKTNMSAGKAKAIVTEEAVLDKPVV